MDPHLTNKTSAAMSNNKDHLVGQLTNKTSAASLAGRVRKPLQPPPTTCSRIQPTKRVQEEPPHMAYYAIVNLIQKVLEALVLSKGDAKDTDEKPQLHIQPKMLLNKLNLLPLNVSEWSFIRK